LKLGAETAESEIEVRRNDHVQFSIFFRSSANLATPTDGFGSTFATHGGGRWFGRVRVGRGRRRSRLLLGRRGGLFIGVARKSEQFGI
jgi:hypothetical protein